jgi:hypothetical protein
MLFSRLELTSFITNVIARSHVELYSAPNLLPSLANFLVKASETDRAIEDDRHNLFNRNLSCV